MLSRDQILHAEDLIVEEIDVPEWGGKVFLRVMTGTNRGLYDGKYAKINEMPHLHHDVRIQLLIYTLCDEHGNQLFTNQDIPILGAKNGSVIDRLFDIAMEMNGIGKKGVENETKNLNAEVNGTFGSC